VCAKLGDSTRGPHVIRTQSTVAMAMSAVKNSKLRSLKTYEGLTRSVAEKGLRKRSKMSSVRYGMHVNLSRKEMCGTFLSVEGDNDMCVKTIN
jgi:hypothetical protein